MGLSVLLKSPLIYRNITPGHTKPIWRYNPIFFFPARSYLPIGLFQGLGNPKGTYGNYQKIDVRWRHCRSMGCAIESMGVDMVT